MTTDNGVLGREAGEQLLWNPVLLPWDWVQGGLSSVQTSPLSVMLIMALVWLDLLIYLFRLHWVFIAAQGLSIVAVCGLLTAAASLMLQNMSSRVWSSQ